MANFVGKWKQVNRTNVEAFLALLEVPEDKKAKAMESAMSLVVDITYDGALSLTLTTTTGTRQVKLVKGQDCEYVSTTGKKMMVNPSEIADSESKAVIKSADGSKDWGTMVGSVSGDTMTVTMNVFEVESVSTFKKA